MAEQVDALSRKPVRVIPTGGIPEGFAALLRTTPRGDGRRQRRGHGRAAARVVPGEVTRAVRDATTEAGPVQEGEYLGVSRDGIGDRRPAAMADAACSLAALLDDRHEIVTVIEGEGATAADTRRITEWLARSTPR